jgi:hypothetical protein
MSMISPQRRASTAPVAWAMQQRPVSYPRSSNRMVGPFPRKPRPSRNEAKSHALRGRTPGEFLVPLSIVLLEVITRLASQQLMTKGEVSASVAIGQEAVVANPARLQPTLSLLLAANPASGLQPQHPRGPRSALKVVQRPLG